MVNLFCGGGGLYSGFTKAGFETVFATDIEPSAAATFAMNAPNVRFHQGDIRHLTPTEVASLAGGRAIDLVVGGPPCQGFSTIGDQIQGDARNGLFEAYARLVRWIQPRAFLMENTNYLRSQYGGRYENEITSFLEAMGYSVSVRTLNAADFGTPQIRKRVFFVGTRLDADFAWPKPTYGEAARRGAPLHNTVGDAIMDIADAEANPLPNHVPLSHGEIVKARYRLIPEGGRLPPPQELPPEIRRRNFGNTYKRLHRDRPSLTLVPGNNAFPVHPTEDRSLTAREAARLQGFSDRYVFAGSRAEQCKLVGNAVPVPLAFALARAMRRHLESNAGGSIAKLKASPPARSKHSSTGSLAVLPRSKGRQLTACSFFTGAGGLLLGFLRSGFAITGSVDRKNIVARNMDLNFPEVRHLRRDLHEMDAAEAAACFGASPDVVFGGPPCQGFSVFGKRRFTRTRGHDPGKDPLNELTLRYIDLAIALSPKVIFMENVKGFLSTPRGETTYLAEVLKRLESAGYEADCQLVNCADFGAPQLRERVLLVATAPGIEFESPQPKYFAEPRPWQRPYTTVGDVIADLADPVTHGEEFSHVPMAHKELVAERFMLIPEGGRLPEKDLPDRLRKGYRSNNVRNYSHVYKRLSRSLPATTMVPGHNAFPVHPTLPRTLTVREAARIQTFPDWMRFVGTRQQQCMLVGNAVPPLVAEVFAQRIAKAIAGNAQDPGYKADIYELKSQMA
jgi:DNA (cytosine-5)-methyltransferase 1